MDFATMDSQARAFEAPLESRPQYAATPLRCPRTMTPQPLVPWTPARLAGALMMALMSAPTLLLAPATNRRRA